MDKHTIRISYSAAETAQIGFAFGITYLKQKKRKDGNWPRVFCLYGPLGSGKTTFTQGLAKGLGIDGRLLSPTFIIVRRYYLGAIQEFFYHIDLYRLKHLNEIKELGLSEIFSDHKSIAVVEWADKLGVLKPNRCQDIYFEAIDKDKHKIAFSNNYKYE